MNEEQLEEVKARVRASAFEGATGRRTVHSFSPPPMMLGADWDEDKLLEVIDEAEEVRWLDPGDALVGHELALVHKGHILLFEVKREAERQPI